MMVLEIFKQYFSLYVSVSIIVFFMYAVINTFRFLDAINNIVRNKIKEMDGSDE